MRLYWTLAGNAALAITFGILLHKHPKLPSLTDAVCLLLVLSLVFARYIDIRYCKGETGDGKTATMAVWRRYSLLIVLGSVCVWLAIRFLIPLLAK
jgi:hypothetical protein